ncbi:MAG: 5'/3'-nucleotidase SurE [Thermosediminibacteraceae bacterium]|nr:5'/3'-nucleotidase SurE [Thermosediminibacteraceae bacterium]
MRPLILVTNDDGILSPGLLAAAEAVCELGDLLIVAPRFQQSGMGRSYPRNADTGIIEKFKVTVNGKEIDAYGVHGSPAQAVAHGVLELADRKIDMCVSGINYGQNLGSSITCSGTVGAALEANSYGISAIAVSREADLNIQHSSDYVEINWEVAKRITSAVAYEVLKNGLPEGISILNINVPERATCDSEVRITKLSKSSFSIFLKPPRRDFNKGYILKSQIYVDVESEDKDTDVYAFYVDKVISITPLSWDLTSKVEWKCTKRFKTIFSRNWATGGPDYE